MHVPKEKLRKLDAKAGKCILVGYSDEQKGYKCYNPRTKQACVSCDVVFEESASWYLPPTLDLNSNPRSDYEASEAKMPLDEREIGTLDESSISFQLSGPNGRLSPFDQSEEESASSGESVVLSLQRKKMSGHVTNRNESDRRVSDSEESDEGSSRRSQHRVMSNYVDLPAKRTLLYGSSTTSTWRITMRT